MTGQDTKPEFVRVIDVSGLKPGVREQMSFEATVDECTAIAARLKLLALTEFSADLYVLRELSGDVSVFGDLTAELEQACVVTLDPVKESVEASVLQRFTARDDDDDDDADDEDPPEPIRDDEIEVGEVLVQNLSLALNPYPRAPGAAFETVDDMAGEPSGPFAALAQLRETGEKAKKE